MELRITPSLIASLEMGYSLRSVFALLSPEEEQAGLALNAGWLLLKSLRRYHSNLPLRLFLNATAFQTSRDWRPCRSRCAGCSGGRDSPE